jgi:dihydroorotase
MTSVNHNPRIVINDATLLDNSTAHTIVIQNGIIESISESGVSENTAPVANHNHGTDTVHIDAQGCIAVPGMCDLYTRLREPGLTRKGTIASEANAALSAGFTQILCAPDTSPAIDTIATVQLIRDRAQLAQGAQVIPIAALTVGLQGEQLSELATLQAAGCLVAGQADTPVSNTNVLFSAMEYAASFNLTLFMTARDAQLGADGCAHTGAVATRLGLPGIPVAAETVALSQLLEICRETSCRLHVSRISSARAVQMIDAAKQAGLPVSCDVGLHHLFFMDEHLAGYDASFHSAVPFRSKADREALREGVATSIIDAICTDHAPHDTDANLAPFPATESGLSAYQWAIPLVLQLPELLQISLAQVFDKLIDAPRRIVHGSADSTLTVKKHADFFLLNPAKEVPQDFAAINQTGKNHPLNCHRADTLGIAPLHGQIKHVFHAGRHHQPFS